MRLRQVAFQQAPHPRLETPISRLVVPLPQPSEYTEDPRVPLSGKRPVRAFERLVVARRSHITIDHRPFDVRRNVATGVLENRRQVISRMAGQSVLEV